jgi:hypothetical protein
MKICELRESYDKSEIIEEKFYDAIGIKDYEKALHLNEQAYRLTIGRYLNGNNRLRVRALSELDKLTEEFRDLKDILLMGDSK